MRVYFQKFLKTDVLIDHETENPKLFDYQQIMNVDRTMFSWKNLDYLIILLN